MSSYNREFSQWRGGSRRSVCTTNYYELQNKFVLQFVVLPLSEIDQPRMRYSLGPIEHLWIRSLQSVVVVSPCDPWKGRSRIVSQVFFVRSPQPTQPGVRWIANPVTERVPSGESAAPSKERWVRTLWFAHRKRRLVHVGFPVDCLLLKSWLCESIASWELWADGWIQSESLVTGENRKAGSLKLMKFSQRIIESLSRNVLATWICIYLIEWMACIIILWFSDFKENCEQTDESNLAESVVAGENRKVGVLKLVKLNPYHAMSQLRRFELPTYYLYDSRISQREFCVSRRMNPICITCCRRKPKGRVIEADEILRLQEDWTWIAVTQCRLSCVDLHVYCMNRAFVYIMSILGCMNNGVYDIYLSDKDSRWCQIIYMT